ncbi:MAG: glycosyltransferase family A protein [Nanoarchaeota archaeon]|nr:glycosyltransferase family A protein [Nanoarchaeota archaeon]
MNRRLGVVTPVYNTPDRDRTRYLVDTVDSALAQNLDYTFLIVDNGSTDQDTLDFYETIRDSRVQIERIGRRQGQKGTPSRSLNFGFNFLFDEGYDAFCYLHSDDLLTEDSLERRMEKLDEGDGMVYGRTALLFDSGLKYRNFPDEDENVNSVNVLRNGFPHHSSMWARRMMDELLKSKQGILFDENVEANEDIGVTLYCRRFIERGFDLGFADDVVYVWRDHPGNITNSVSAKVQRQQSIYAYEQNGLEHPSEYTWKHTIKHLGSRFIPYRFKEPLRPLRDKISEITNGRLFPSKPLRKVDLNPYWFRERELVPS